MHKKLIYILLLISFFSLTFGCQTESYDFGREDGSIEVLEDGRLRVPILLHIPEREVVETKTTPNDAEKAVKTVDVCVFDAASGNRLEKVLGVIDPNNPLRVFATVSPRNVACQVQVYVNIPARCRVAFNAADNKTKIDALTMSNVIFNNDSITKNGLPMVSDLDPYTALNRTTLKDKVANLTFAYARIDITNNATGFTLASCQGLNFRQSSYLTARTPLALSNMYKSTEITQLTGIYLFESPGSNPTDLIIKGTKTGFGEGYYKIRIAYLNENIKTYDIRRGFRYAVTITSVKGPGYASAEEAIANEPSNVEVDITVNDGSSKDVVISNGSYYLGVSNSEFIVCADNAYGVTATTLSHNAPGSVSTATIQVQGEGITLSANQQGLTVSQNGKSATINLQTPKVPIKVNLTSAVTQPGTLTIRIGDLVKTISIKKMAMVAESGKTITLSELELANSSIVTMNSLSPRITVGQDKSLVVGQVVNSNYHAYSYAEAFSTGQQGTIRIAVKQKIENVVYYEQYEDDSYGFYFRDNTSTLSDTKTIKDTGYGILGTRSDITKIGLALGVGSQSFDNPSNAIVSGFPDCSLILYPMSHKVINPVGHTNAVGVFINNAQTTTNYIYPNFAKVISISSSISTGTQGYPAFSIRTPKQFRNINTMAVNSTSRFFKQERDLNFADTNIGGAASFATAIIANSFTGNYDGGMKAIRNLKIIGANDLALFKLNSGTIRKLIVEDCVVSGQAKIACIASENNAFIEEVYVKQPTIISNTTEDYSYAAVIVGLNNYVINNCLIAGETLPGVSLVTGNKSGVAAVAGCNNDQNSLIHNVCVIDASLQNAFVSGTTQDKAGIVGINKGNVIRALYIAKSPKTDQLKPIVGSGRLVENSYYLKNSSVNTDKPNFGIGYTTNQFSDMSLGVFWNFWEKVPGYPYPKLKSFPVPSTYPVANN